MRRLVFACAALAFLTACRSGQPEPIEPKADASGTPTASAPSSLTPPALPKQAQQRSEEGMASFAGYWVRTLNFSVQSLDSDPLRLISSADCDGCTSYIKQIDSDRQKDVRSRGFKWVPRAATFTESDHVTVDVSAAEYRRIGAHGVMKVVRAARYKVGFEVEWSRGGWLVRELFLP